MINFSANQPQSDKQYIKRVGAYAVISGDNNLIALVKTGEGYFLPGGGVEAEESLETCLKRECLEEIGAEVSALDNFACGNYFFYSTTLDRDMESVGHFFKCRIDKFLDVATEADHELVWMDIEQAIERLYLDHQKEAIRIFRKNID